MIDAKAFGEELAGIVKAATAPLIARLDALEKRLDTMPQAQTGQDVDPQDIAAIVRSQVQGDLDALRTAVSAIQQATQQTEIRSMVATAVEEAVKAIPAPQDGKDADPDEVAGIVSSRIGDDINEIREGLEAISKRPVGLGEDQVAALVAAAQQELRDELGRELRALPMPRDGEPGTSVTPADVAPMIAEEVAKAVAALPPAPAGVGLAGAMIDRDGELVITLSNGEIKKLGPVVGKDAAPAAPGRDGLGFEDMDFEVKDGRLFAVFRRGDVMKEAMLPGLSYRGVWKEGEYLVGDSVTYAASQWIALEQTSEKPGEGKSWQLAVRKGRDGRDGELKAARETGPVLVGKRKEGQ